MSWIVIDNNEAKRLPVPPVSYQDANIEGVTISPFILKELLCHPPNRKYVEKLARYPVRLGMPPRGVMRRIVSLPRSQIVTFSPFYDLTPQEVQWVLLDPPAQWLKKFVAEVDTYIKTSSKFLNSLQRKVRHDLKSRGYHPKFADFTEALQKLALGPDNLIERWFMQIVSADGLSSVGICPQELYMGAMDNAYLRHHFHTVLWYMLSFQWVWDKQHGIEDNEWIDMTLTLYAAPGRSVT